MSSAITLWLTGLSGAGKSTLATALRQALQAQDRPCVVLDGDVLRSGPHADLDHSAEGKRENVRRTGELAIAAQADGLCAIVSLVSPCRTARDALRARHASLALRFAEVHVDTPLAVCAAHDAKGLYAAQARGHLVGLTGVDAPYEEPLSPELRLSPFRLPLAACVAQLLALIASPR
jgi:adenylyl-sulfate kinase